MHRFLRAALRSVGFIGATTTIQCAWLVSRLVAPAGSRERHRQLAMRTWARVTAALLGMRINVVGSRPQAPFLLVANHLGYLDVIALAAVADCTFVARGDLSDWPLIGWLARGIGTIFVDRDRRSDVVRVGAAIEAALARRRGVVIFPEGTSTAGTEVAPFKSALLETVAANTHPVHFASLTYAVPEGERPAHLSVCWWGDMTLLSHLFSLFKLPAIDARVRFGDRPVHSSDRKELARLLHDGVSKIFIPVREAKRESRLHTEVTA